LTALPVTTATLGSSWLVTLSYGDLSHASGYRTRVLGELEHLDSRSGLDPFLLLFDRKPEEFSRHASTETPFRAVPRASTIRFYPEIARLSRQHSIAVVHAHNLYSACLALSARPLHKYKVVLDYHGRIPEEYVYLGKGGETSRRALERLERWTIRESDHLIVVSDKLRRYVQERYDTPDEKVSVIPCATDARRFKRDATQRTATRSRLGLEDRFVCTHLGSFFEWYDPELLMAAFRCVRDRVPNAHLLVVTAEAGRVQEFISARISADQVTVMTAAHDEVPALLNASDVGFLLLRSSPNIETSSPVKFAEYLNCGVPVVITPGVGDYSDMVREEQLGLVFKPGAPLDVSKLVVERETVAARCAAAGGSLQWQSLLEPWQTIVQRLVRSRLNES